MRFRDDTRGVTVQVGAVLLFATIIIALSLYQATVVPSQNADVEYKHSQQVQGQLADVRNALLSTAAAGDGRPASVALGTQYPSRAFLMNPPPPAGTLRTGSYENDTISVSNVRATNAETADFLADNWSAPTKYLAYEPDYHEYDGAPDRLFESSVLSNYYPNTNGGTAVPLTDQVVVRENTITLVSLNGSLSTSRPGAVSVEPEALSAPYRRVQVTNQSAGPVNVTLPTRVSASALVNTTDLLAEDAVKTVEPAGDGRVRVVLYNGTYTLRTASVGVGSHTTNPGPRYLTVVDRDDDSVTVEARDAYNNPESGVNVSVNGTNPFQSSSRVTGEDGRATFVAEDGEDETATLEILGGDSTQTRVTTTVDTVTSGGGGRLVSLRDGRAFDGADADATPGGVNVTVRNTYGTNVTITDVTVAPENRDLDGLSDEASGEGDGRSELHVETVSGDQQASTDVPMPDDQYVSVGERGLTLSAEQSREERVYDTGDGSFTETASTFVGSPVELAAGEDATISFAEFYELSSNGATAVNVSDEDFRVAVSYTRGDDASTDEFVVYASPPGADDDGGNGEPNVDTFQTTDTSSTGGNPKYAQFDVDWAVSDDNDLQNLEITMTRVSDGQVVDSVSPPVSGQTESGQSTLRGENQNANPSGQQYDITVTVTDDQGQTTTQTKRVTV